MLRTTLFCVGRRAMVALRRPWISATLITMMLVDACTLPHGSTLGRTFNLGITRCGCRLGPYGGWTEAVVVRAPEGLVLHAPEEAVDIAEDAVVASVSCNPRRQPSGVWAITRETWDPTVHISPGITATPLTAEETLRVRSDYADVVERSGWNTRADYGDLIRAGSGAITRVTWTGYTHNAISATLATALLLSFGWVRDQARAKRERLAILIGLCPSCRYDLRGEHEQGCPECGWRRQSSN